MRDRSKMFAIGGAFLTFGSYLEWGIPGALMSFGLVCILAGFDPGGKR